ncbi:MAG TPA: hypothetical protein VKQ36_09200 [Ktedonobacterales bacterium]|nr:hypothetical protein [Ktedonobacterales bacterium]
MDWVVRGGVTQATTLINGYLCDVVGAPDVTYGFVVQHAAEKAVWELSGAGQFPNGQISYASAAELAAALAPLGYQLHLMARPGRGFHVVVGVSDASGVSLQTLPQDAATALSRTFTRQVYPYPSRGAAQAAAGRPGQAMKRIAVDFTTRNGEPIDLVRIAGVGSAREQEILPLRDGERVVVWEPGLEVEATLVLYGGDYWMARPDQTTWRDLPLSPEEWAALEQVAYQSRG